MRPSTPHPPQTDAPSLSAVLPGRCDLLITGPSPQVRHKPAGSSAATGAKSHASKAAASLPCLFSSAPSRDWIIMQPMFCCLRMTKRSMLAVPLLLLAGNHRVHAASPVEASASLGKASSGDGGQSPVQARRPPPLQVAKRLCPALDPASPWQCLPAGTSMYASLCCTHRCDFSFFVRAL